MDVKRSWPWKKKSSDKIIASTDSADSSPVHSSRHPDDQDLSRVLADHGRLSEDSTGQMQPVEEKLKHVEGRLSAALMDISVKDDLVKQHTKLAEEAVSGWEKAETEAVALRQQLDAALQQKLAAEDRVSHLDGALKECMRQLRHAREEQEQKIHEAILKKTRDWDKIRCELEEKLEDVGRQLMETGAKGNAMSKSLQEQAKTISEISEARSRAETDIEVLKVGFDSVENQNTALKYEVHLLSKELEIRNEEREISRRTADAASKQHLEDVKKFAKLEAECQRLRALVRKKLPGPASLAQMKFEVETLEKEKTESNRRRSSGKGGGSPKAAPIEPLQGSTCDNGVKETEALVERVCAMEEETKMLKEVLAKRNSELQSARLMCARTASKLSNVEEQLNALSHSQGLIRTPGMTGLDMHIDASTSLSVSKEPSQASISEDGNDDEQSNAESWASALIAELAHFKKGKVTQIPDKTLDASSIDLMDDFIEMERLASMSPSKIESVESGCDRLNCDNDNSVRVEWGSQMGIVGEKDKEVLERKLAKKEAELQAANQLCKEVCSKLTSAQEQLTSVQSKNASNESSLVSLQEKLDMIFEASEGGVNIGKVLEQVRVSMGVSSHSSVARLRAHIRRLSKGSYPSDTSSIRPPEGSELANRSHISASTDSSSGDEALSSVSDTEGTTAVGPELTSAVCKVVRLMEDLVVATTAHEFAVFPDRESQNGSLSVEHTTDSDSKYVCNFPKNLELDDDVRKFIAVSNQFLHGKIEIVHFLSVLSSVLSRLTRINFSAGDGSPQSRTKPADWRKSISGGTEPEEMSGANSPISEISQSDGSEEAAKIVPADEHNAVSFEVSKIQEELRNVCAEKLSLESHLRAELSKFVATEEELAQLKGEKVKLENELGSEREKLEHIKVQLHEAEQLVTRLREQLSSAEESRNLADEQLANLAAAKEKLESQLLITNDEFKQANEKVRSLEKEILEQRKRSDEIETKCQKLQEQLKNEVGSSYFHCASAAAAADEEARLNKEREIAAAAERLAECQRTILVLGKQLKSLASPGESMDMSYDSQASSAFVIEKILSGKDSIHFQSQQAISGRGTIDASGAARVLEDQERFSGAKWYGREQRDQDSGWDEDVDISDILDSELANISKRGRGSRKPMIDLFGDRTPVHEDYIEAVALMPSSPEMDPVSPPRSLPKRAPRRKRSPRSFAGIDLSKSMNDAGSPAPSEKHGSSFSRFFSRNKTSH